MELDEIHIHILETPSGLSPDREADFLCLLPSHEIEQYRNFGLESRRREFLWSRLLLRRSLSAYSGKEMGDLKFSSRNQGKPFLEGSRMGFSLTHTDGLVACSFGYREVGLDIEKVDVRARPSWRKLAKRFFTPEEREYLISRPQELRPTAFFKVFTLKEAAAKATGLGLGWVLKDFTVPFSILDRAQMGRLEYFTQTVKREYCLSHAADHSENIPLHYEIQWWEEESLVKDLKTWNSAGVSGIRALQTQQI
jgi:4'-phosphopantetheinyl transferase